MSLIDQATAELLSQILLAGDGVILGLGFAYIAIRSVLKFTSITSALRKIEQAPDVSISDLRSLLDSPSDNDSSNSDKQLRGEKLVIVRGAVQAKSTVKADSDSLRSGNVLVSNETGDRGVISQRTQTCISVESGPLGLFGLSPYLRSLHVLRSQRKLSASIRTVPFVLVEARSHGCSDYVFVNMEGSKHPLPLTTIYQHMQPIHISFYQFLQSIILNRFPVEMVDEEKILPIGKMISAVGVCSLRDGEFEIKSCEDLPYFLSDITKDQMIIDLVFKSKVLFWSSVTLGSIALGLFCFAAVRNWRRWKARRLQRHTLQQLRSMGDDITIQDEEEEENEDIPDGQLCVICLTRRKRCAFIPCGHLVCCRICIIPVQSEVSPKCPVCRQTTDGAYLIRD